MKKLNLLLALSITLGMGSPCYGLYVMVRSGFGELKGDDVGSLRKEHPNFRSGLQHRLFRDNRCTSGTFKYKDHKNLSVALGGRFDIFNVGSFGLEVEVLGAYANLDRKNRDLVEVYGRDAFRPDFFEITQLRAYGAERITGNNNIALYLKNQRIAGAQINAYWEQYILNWLSVGIGGGIGGAYVCTKFTTLEWLRRHGNEIWIAVTDPSPRRKYVHSGSLLYNFMCFVRAEKFETLFEVGYRHIGLHQMFGGRMYGHNVKKLANFHSDQIYLGIGRTF